MNLEVVEGEKEKPPPFCEIDEEHNEFPVADVVEEDDDEGAAEETIIIPPGFTRREQARMKASGSATCSITSSVSTTSKGPAPSASSCSIVAAR